MNRKSFLVSIPMLLLPYLTLFVLATIFFSTKLTFFKFVMESAFNSNALLLIAAFLIYCLLTATFTTICFVVSIYKKWDAISLAKTAMIVKLIQIPAYILIFVLGVLLAFTVFTIPFSIGLFLVDCLSVLLTSLFVISSVITTIRQETIKLKDVIWILILQFVFCIDVVSSVVFYIKLKNRNKQICNLG